jgi:tight adherence protein C
MGMEMIVIMVCIVGAAVAAGLALKPEKKLGVTQRLQRMQAGNTTGGAKMVRDQEEMQKSFVERVALPMAEKFSKIFAGITPVGMIDKCRRDIASAGLTGKVTGTQLTTLSYMLAIGLPIFWFFLTSIKPERSSKDWMMIGLCCLIGYRLPFGVVQGKANKRKHEIQKALPFTLDLISISVEAGMGLDGAMGIVAEKTTGPLTDELNMTLNEIRLGKGRNEALLDMASRVNLDDLKNFLNAVVYISRLGGSLVDVIRIQAGDMRIKRRQRAEEKAMKTPVKIMIPLVLFIFPALFVVVLGPAGIQLMENFGAVGK